MRGRGPRWGVTGFGERARAGLIEPVRLDERRKAKEAGAKGERRKAKGEGAQAPGALIPTLSSAGERGPDAGRSASLFALRPAPWEALTPTLSLARERERGASGSASGDQPVAPTQPSTFNLQPSTDSTFSLPPSAFRLERFRPARLACVLVPDFPVAVERLDRPELAGLPVVIGGAPDERKAVIACSAEARREGIRIGMPLRSVLGRCPMAVVVEARHARYREIAGRIERALALLSPEVEPVASGELFASLDGLLAIHGTEERLAAALQAAAQAEAGLAVRVGVANGKFSARLAALLSKAEPKVLGDDAVAGFLADLPVRVLPVDPSLVQRLGRLGIRRLGDLAALPFGAVQAQFGPEGRRAWELASGIDDEMLRPTVMPDVLGDRFVFEQPATTFDLVLLAAKRLIMRLIERPAFRYRAARGMAFQATLASGQVWERQLTLREPMSDARRMLLTLQGKLVGFPPSAAVEEIRVSLTGLCPEGGVQAPLAIRGRTNPRERVKEAIDQLKARFGTNPISTIVEVEPWSRIPERRMALITYDP